MITTVKSFHHVTSEINVPSIYMEYYHSVKHKCPKNLKKFQNKIIVQQRTKILHVVGSKMKDFEELFV